MTTDVTNPLLPAPQRNRDPARAQITTWYSLAQPPERPMSLRALPSRIRESALAKLKTIGEA
jgi:hypothetical protein